MKYIIPTSLLLILAQTASAAPVIGVPEPSMLSIFGAGIIALFAAKKIVDRKAEK